MDRHLINVHGTSATTREQSLLCQLARDRYNLAGYLLSCPVPDCRSRSRTPKNTQMLHHFKNVHKEYKEKPEVVTDFCRPLRHRKAMLELRDLRFAGEDLRTGLDVDYFERHGVPAEEEVEEAREVRRQQAMAQLASTARAQEVQRQARARQAGRGSLGTATAPDDGEVAGPSRASRGTPQAHLAVARVRAAEVRAALKEAMARCPAPGGQGRGRPRTPAPGGAGRGRAHGGAQAPGGEGRARAQGRAQGPERAGRREEPSRPERPGRREEPSRPEPAGRREEPSRPERAGRREEPSRPERAGRREEPSRPERPGRREEPSRPRARQDAAEAEPCEDQRCRQRLREAQRGERKALMKLSSLQARVSELESDLAVAQAENTLKDAVSGHVFCFVLQAGRQAGRQSTDLCFLCVLTEARAAPNATGYRIPASAGRQQR